MEQNGGYVNDLGRRIRFYTADGAPYNISINLDIDIYIGV